MSIWIEAQTYGHLEEGDNFHLQEYLGAHKETRGEQEGLPAPNAQAVDLIGDFTDWEARKIPMVRNEEASGKSSVPMQKRRYIQVFGDPTNGHQVQKSIL